MAASGKQMSNTKLAVAIWFAIISILFGVIYVAPISTEYKSKMYRAQSVFVIESVILMCGRYIWTHLFRNDRTLLPRRTGTTSSASGSGSGSGGDHKHVRVMGTSLTAKDVVARASLAVFLLAAQGSYVTNIYFNRTNPHWFPLLCYTCYGFFIQLILALLIINFVHWTALSVRFNKWRKHHRFLLACAYALVVGSYGIYNATKLPQVKHVEIPIKDLPESMENFRIVQLTDIHLGPTVGQRRLTKIVNIANTLDADIVVMTGDLVEGSVATLGQAARPLYSLHAKQGKFFVSGNHEYYTGVVDEWFSYLDRAGFTVLHNSHVLVRRDEDFFYLAGTDDIQANRIGYKGHGMDIDKAVSTCEPHHPIIFLAHQPKAAKLIIDSRYTDVQLVISGHTHGGQMLPFNIPTFLMNPFYAGLYRYRGRHVYVSQGTQFWGVPMRIASRMEITEITLTRQTDH